VTLGEVPRAGSRDVRFCVTVTPHGGKPFHGPYRSGYADHAQKLPRSLAPPCRLFTKRQDQESGAPHPWDHYDRVEVPNFYHIESGSARKESLTHCDLATSPPSAHGRWQRRGPSEKDAAESHPQADWRSFQAALQKHGAAEKLAARVLLSFRRSGTFP